MMRKRNTTPYGVPPEYERGASVSSSSTKHLTAGTIPMLVDTQSVNDRMMLRHRMKLKKSASNKAHGGRRKKYKKRHSHEPCVQQRDGVDADRMEDEGHLKFRRIRSNSTTHSRRIKEERRRGVVQKYNGMAERRGRSGRSGRTD